MRHQIEYCETCSSTYIEYLETRTRDENYTVIYECYDCGNLTEYTRVLTQNKE